MRWAAPVEAALLATAVIFPTPARPWRGEPGVGLNRDPSGERSSTSEGLPLTTAAAAPEPEPP